MLRRLHADQPESFAFTPENQAWAEAEMTKYPEGRQASAVIAILWRAQEQEGWLTRPAIEAVADMLGITYMRALEVATFYFQFQLAPTGSVTIIQICGTTSCMICGAEDLIGVCREKIADQPHTVSADGKFSWEEVECQGACANAPMAMIGKDYYEDLTAERLAEIIDELAAGRVPVPGPQTGRFASEPASGLTSLKDFESGKHRYNASVQLATDLGDTVKRIDGTEVPLLAPWRARGAGHTPAAPSVELRETPLEDVTDAGQKATGKAPKAAGDETPLPGIFGPGGKQPETEAPKAKGKAAGGKTPKVKAKEDAPKAEAPKAGTQPEALSAPRAGGADDLKQIKGVGPKLEKLLNEMGFYHFDQIAGWTTAEVAWVDENLTGFKGRVSRDEWPQQAKVLAEGGETEFASRVKKGDVYE